MIREDRQSLPQKSRDSIKAPPVRVQEMVADWWIFLWLLTMMHSRRPGLNTC